MMSLTSNDKKILCKYPVGVQNSLDVFVLDYKTLDFDTYLIETRVDFVILTLMKFLKHYNI